MLTVIIDTSPLSSGHAARGIGTYTRLLTAALDEIEDIKIIRSSTLEKGESPKADITHYPFFDLFFDTLPINLIRPTLVTIHDVIPLKFPEYYPPGVKGGLRFKKQQLALKTVKAVITDSEASRRDIVDLLGVADEKIHVVPLAANPELLTQTESVVNKIRRKYEIPKKYVLYVGDINYNKNIPQLIKMLKYLDKNIHLVCVGKNFVQQEIPEWQWIETQIALSDVGSRVHFVTNVLTDSAEELSAIYSGALCYVQPSLYEGFGLPVLEAMQCRTPVVATEVASLPEVGGEYALYAKPAAEELAKQVNELLSWSKTRRADWTRAAYKWSQNFSWQKTAEMTAAVYKQIKP